MMNNRLNREKIISETNAFKKVIEQCDRNKFPFDESIKYCETLIEMLMQYKYEINYKFVINERLNSLKTEINDRLKYNIKIEIIEENSYWIFINLFEYIEELQKIASKIFIFNRKYVCEQEKKELLILIMRILDYCRIMVDKKNRAINYSNFNEEETRIKNVAKNLNDFNVDLDSLKSFEDYISLVDEDINTIKEKHLRNIFDEDNSVEINMINIVKKYFKTCFNIDFEIKIRTIDPRVIPFFCYGIVTDNDIAKIIKTYPNARIIPGGIEIDFATYDETIVKVFNRPRAAFIIYIVEDEKEKIELINKDDEQHKKTKQRIMEEGIII